jgi:hypothetical protein
MGAAAVGVVCRVVWGARKNELAGWGRPSSSQNPRHCVQSKSKEKGFAKEPHWDAAVVKEEDPEGLGT